MRYLPMINLPGHRMRPYIVCMIILLTIPSIGAFARSDENLSPQASLDATLKNLPKDKAEAGKVIYEKVIDALGVRENLLKIQDSKISVDYKVMPDNLDLMAVYYMKLPDKLRIDLNGIWTKVFDGKDGWGYEARDRGFKNLSKDALAEFKNSALSVQGMLYPENLSLSPVLEGYAPIQGKNYLVISYANRNGYDTIHVCVDPDTFLPYMSTSRKPGSSISVICSEYREMAGVKLPFSIAINMDGNKDIRMSVREWKLNSNLEDALFVKKSVKAQINKGLQMDPSGFLDSVSTPELIHKVKPLLPELAIRARITGKVLLRVAIDEEGRVRNIAVFQGHPLLDGAAVTAVRQYRYRPTIQNGKPVPITIMVPVEFN